MKEHEETNTAGRIQALVAEEASEWLIRLEDEEASSTDRAAFTDWLTASPRNVSAFLDARATWEALSGRAFAHVPDDETLLRALDVATRPSVVPLHRPASAGSSRRPYALAAGVAGLMLTAGAVLWATRMFDSNHAVFSTSAGEQTTQPLPDGSTVVLNTRSRVRLDWSKGFRDIHLESGEALFDVAADPSRPFRVWAGDSLIRAVGTRFNVYRSEQDVTVTVLEGRVEVKKDGNSQPASALLGAGEQVRIGPELAEQPRRLAAPESVIAWQGRRLIFDGQRLDNVIAEFNRYHDLPLVLEDEVLAAKRIHGVFDATDRDSLIKFLEETDQVKVDGEKRGLVIRRR